MAWRISVSASGSFDCPAAPLRRASRVVIRSRSWGTIADLPARNGAARCGASRRMWGVATADFNEAAITPAACSRSRGIRSEEHTSELQSHSDLVCRLLLEKKKQRTTLTFTIG